MRDRSPQNLDSARLRPHLRGQGDALEEYRRRRDQARVLDDAVQAEPEGKPLPLKQAITKPGDPMKLRGIPAIGRGVGGVVPGTSPEGALLAKERAAERRAA